MINSKEKEKNQTDKKNNSETSQHHYKHNKVRIYNNKVENNINNAKSVCEVKKECKYVNCFMTILCSVKNQSKKNYGNLNMLYNHEINLKSVKMVTQSVRDVCSL